MAGGAVERSAILGCECIYISKRGGSGKKGRGRTSLLTSDVVLPLVSASRAPVDSSFFHSSTAPARGSAAPVMRCQAGPLYPPLPSPRSNPIGIQEIFLFCRADYEHLGAPFLPVPDMVVVRVSVSVDWPREPPRPHPPQRQRGIVTGKRGISAAGVCA